MPPIDNDLAVFNLLLFVLGLPLRFARVGLYRSSQVCSAHRFFFAALKKARSGLRPLLSIPQPAALWACKTVYWTKTAAAASFSLPSPAERLSDAQQCRRRRQTKGFEAKRKACRAEQTCELRSVTPASPRRAGSPKSKYYI